MIFNWFRSSTDAVNTEKHRLEKKSGGGGEKQLDLQVRALAPILALLGGNSR